MKKTQWPSLISSFLLFFADSGLADLSSTSTSSGCLDVSLYSGEIRKLKSDFEDIQRMILGQEQVLTVPNHCSKTENPHLLLLVALNFSSLPPLQVLDQVSQTQSTLEDASNHLTRNMQNHVVSIRLLNQSLERYLERVGSWNVVIEETVEKMKSLTEDQYSIKATAQHVNTTMALR